MKAVRFHQHGGPEVLRYEDAEVGEPGPGQVRIRHVAVGLNYADTYFRNGTYPVPLPAGRAATVRITTEALRAPSPWWRPRNVTRGDLRVEVDGREVARGFDILQGSYTTFTNPLTQLPVAFCGGSNENCAPVPGDTLCTWPLISTPGSASTSSSSWAR